jgi:prevent-host-death family protein
MHVISASEAARNFSAVLDSVEHGETIVVTRAGRRVASIAPTAAATGAAFNAVLERWRGVNALDDTLTDNIAAARAAAAAEIDIDPWTG